MRIIPFADEHLAAAGELLAGRHAAIRTTMPTLAPLADPQAVVAKVWQESGGVGVAALNQGLLAGYMIGSTKQDAWKGRSAWVHLAGHAVTSTSGPELLQNLYAALGARLVQRGYFNHHAIVPVCEPGSMAAWHQLSFGQEQVYAIRGTSAGPESPPPGISIRRAGPDDLERILEIADLISRHQAASPVFAPYPPENGASYRNGYAEVLSDASETLWLAEREGRLLGMLLMSLEPQSLLVPSNTCYLQVAITRPEARGQGVMGALTAHALGAAHQAGLTHCVTDWRSTNLLGARVWPKLGFTPTHLRLHRMIDERVLWAQGPAQ